MIKKSGKRLEHLLYFFKDFKQTGAIAPSSKFLAKDLVAQYKKCLTNNDCPPLKILEIGAGTGPLTKQINSLLRPQDQLDVVEIHKKFYQILKKKYYSSDNISAYHTDILKFQQKYQYDFIFSSLPYENMPENISKEIWAKKLNLCTSDAYISYFKYVKFRDFKSDFEERIVQEFGLNEKLVLRNLPPAKVYTLEIKGQSAIPQPAIENANVA